MRRTILGAAVAVALLLGGATAAYATSTDPLHDQTIAIPGISMISSTGDSSSWTLEVNVNPNGAPTMAYVEFCDRSMSNVLSNCQIADEWLVGNGNTNVYHETVIPGLSSNTRYSWNVEAVNHGGLNYTYYSPVQTAP